MRQTTEAVFRRFAWLNSGYKFIRQITEAVFQRYAWFNSGYKFMRQITEAGFPGFNTPRTVFLPCLQAGDARHHGQYGPEGQFYARCSSSSMSSSFPVAAQSLVPMVHTVQQTMRFHDCSSSTRIQHARC